MSIPDPFDDDLDQWREREECECKVCHELFLGYPGDNICDRCVREQVINQDE